MPAPLLIPHPERIATTNAWAFLRALTPLARPAPAGWATLAAARGCGLMTAFFSRPGEYGPHQKRDYAAEQAWDVVAADIGDLATQLGV